MAAQRRLYSYRISLRDVGLDDDPAFRIAAPSVKAEVLRWIVVIGHREKDRELAAGLDRRGKALRPISPRTRKHRDSAMGPADPNAPPLMPAYAASRTRLLLTGEPTADGRAVEYYWTYDANTGDSWGKILDYHRKGIGRSRVKRDVIGISAGALARVRDDVQARWREYQRNGFALPPVNRRPPPGPPPRLQTTGRTDWHNFTYGIGGSGPPAPGVQTTGFRQRVPWTPPAPPRFPPPPTRPTPPTPAAPPAPAPPVDRHAAILRTRVLASDAGVLSDIVSTDEVAALLGWSKARAASVPAVYHPREDRIYFNRDAPYWDDHAGQARELEAAGWWSSGHPMHVAAHEIGHALHRRNVGMRAFADASRPLDPEDAATAEAFVSRYAATDAAEFVAEVHAMLRAGKRPPDAVMELYNRLGGVVP